MADSLACSESRAVLEMDVGFFGMTVSFDQGLPSNKQEIECMRGGSGTWWYHK